VKIDRRAIMSTMLSAGMLLGSASLSLLSAQEPNSPAPDNTKVNERDRSPAEATADQQKENRSDLDITQQIRKSIMKDKSLSTYAHNVKVITQNGMVTLKGPVRSEDEKQAIAAKAEEVAGAGKVANQLDVKSKN